MGSIVVTGGASGIGAAVVRRLWRRKQTTVWIGDTDEERLGELGRELPAAQLRTVDVSDAAAVDELVREAASSGGLEAVVACAGISCVGEATERDPSRWKHVLHVNTLGVMHLVRSALVPMQAQRSGLIVVVASASGRLSYVGEPAYVASKHAVVAFCDAVRKEIVGTDVRMGVVEPGLVDTPMARNHPAIDEVLGKVVPLDADDVARAVEFILDQPAHCSINELLLRPTNQDL